LKIETQPRDDHQVNMIVEIEPEQMTGAKHRAARRISERKISPVFAPGKLPMMWCFEVLEKVLLSKTQ